jgi:hypothetical protein
MCLNGIKGSKEGENCNKALNGKAIIKLPEVKNRRKSFKTVWPQMELQVFGF